MKKIVSVLLASILLFTFSVDLSLFDINVSAETSSYFDYIEKTMKKGLDNFQTQIKFKSPKNNDVIEFGDDIIEVYRKLMSEKEYFYVIYHECVIVTWNKKPSECTLKVKYITGKKNLEKYRKKFYKAIEKSVSGIKDNWTDIQKVAYFHDRLVSETEFSTDELTLITTPYSVLINKKGYRSGYARALSILLREVGIESKLVANNKLGRQWNLVKIGKKWYHVDCGSDEKMYNGVQVPYYVFHDTFLKSDSAMSEYGNFSSKGLATSTKFDNMDWATTSPFGYYGNGIIYYTEKGVYVYDTVKNKKSKLFSTEDNWEIQVSNGRKFWTEGFTHIAYYNNYIYYNLAHGIYKYNPQNGKIETVYTNKKTDNLISAIYVSNNKLYAVFLDVNNNTNEKLIKKL